MFANTKAYSGFAVDDVAQAKAFYGDDGASCRIERSIRAFGDTTAGAPKLATT